MFKHITIIENCSTNTPHDSKTSLGLGKYNREPSTEPKEPSTGTEKTGTEKFRFYFGSTF